MDSSFLLCACGCHYKVYLSYKQMFKTLTLKSLYLSNQKILKKMRAVSLFDTFGVI